MWIYRLQAAELAPPLRRTTLFYSFSPVVSNRYSTAHLAIQHHDEEEKGYPVSYTFMLRKCVETSNLNHARAIHAKFIKKSDCLSDSLIYCNHLLNAYVKCGGIMDGLQLFNEMPQKNVVSWTALIAGFVQKGFPVEAFSLFSLMHKTGIKPNEFTFVSALHSCSFSDCLSLIHAYQVYSLIIRFGFECNAYLVNAFLTALIRQGLFDEALKLFEGCLYKDIVAWNAILGGFLKFSCYEVPRFWYRMVNEGIVPDGFTFSSVLTGLAELSDLRFGLQVHGQLVKSGHGSEMCVGNSLVDMYLKNQQLADGFKAFEEIPRKDVCSWTQMTAGCLHCGKPTEALRVFEAMRRTGIKPNMFTLATALNACANLATLEEGEKVHNLRVKQADDIDMCVDNALLDMYAKCGSMDSALKVFRAMSEHSVVSWTTMIIGYAQNGEAKKALEMFEEMRREGVKPNHITLVSLLYACSQGGLVDKGWEYFSSISQEFGISPEEDHYACMVNLLGRAGRIKEAEELILGMPFKPSVLIWQTLLGACRLHGDVDAAKRAAGHALALDTSDTSTYVLLSNTLADLDNWNSAEMLRHLMKNRDVKKTPGSCWLEINRQ